VVLCASFPNRERRSGEDQLPGQAVGLPAGECVIEAELVADERQPMCQWAMEPMGWVGKMIFDCRNPQQLETALALHPLFQPAFQYWRSLRDQGLPNRHDIDPIEIPELLANVMLLDAVEGGADFRYRLAGTAVEHNFGASIKGVSLSAIVQTFPTIQPILDVKRHCVATGSPHACDAAVFTHFGTKKQLYCFAMPLSDDGHNVTQIFAIGILERAAEPPHNDQFNRS
jgi:hypothetical protein